MRFQEGWLGWLKYTLIDHPSNMLTKVVPIAKFKKCSDLVYCSSSYACFGEWISCKRFDSKWRIVIHIVNADKHDTLNALNEINESILATDFRLSREQARCQGMSKFERSVTTWSLKWSRVHYNGPLGYVSSTCAFSVVKADMKLVYKLEFSCSLLDSFREKLERESVISFSVISFI